MWAVVPVKRFSDAKSRLANILSPAERESLAQVMLNDVLRAICDASLVSGFAVVSHEIRARYVIERLGGLYVEESGTGLSDAIRQAGKWLHEHGQRGLLMIPGDVPLVRGHDIDMLIAGHQGSRAVSIVPDREHDGTNGLVVTPPDAIDFKFGRGSFEKHISQCEALTIEPRIVRSAGLELDIDHPMDLQTLVSYESYNETESLSYLMDSGIANRLRREKAKL